MEKHRSNEGQGDPKRRRVQVDTSPADHVPVYKLLKAYMTEENGYDSFTEAMNTARAWFRSTVYGSPDKHHQFTLGVWKEFHANPRWSTDTAPDRWAELHERIDALITKAAEHHLREQQARTAGAGAAAAGAGNDAGAGAAEDNNPDDTAAVESVGDYDCPVSLAGSMPMFPAGTTISHAAFQQCVEDHDVRIKFQSVTVAFAAFAEAARTGVTEDESKTAAGPAPANSSGATEDESKAAAGPAPANSSGAGAARSAAAAAAHFAAAHFAAALRSMCVDLAAIVARKPAEEPSPDCDIKDSVWEIEHVRKTAARVLSASVCTPAGILLSALLKVGANPALELDGALLLAVEAYITTTAPDSWKQEPTQTHARDAFSVARILTNKRIGMWSNQNGELALECLQVGPIVRRPLEAVFDTLHCNVALKHSTLIARVSAVAGQGGAGQSTSIKKGASLQVQPDIAVQLEGAVLALGETKHQQPENARTDNFKLACMSAAACGALQIKIRRSTNTQPEHGKCQCGEWESLFPIPLIESYDNVLKLYYGKTWHDEKGGKCQHRVGCFFSLEMKTWADALLALSVMQAAANDMKDRWDATPGKDTFNQGVPGLGSMASARTTVQGTTRGTPKPPDDPGAGAGGGGKGTNYAKRTATLHADMAALQSAGVAGVKTLFAMPLPVVWEAGCTPSTSDWNCPRVYHGTWTHNGAARAVVVKVVSRSQAADEVAVLEAVGARKQARAIQVLAQIPVNDGDVGLVTPYCPGKLFEGAPSLHHVLCQAIQLCEAVMAWHAAGVLHLDLKPSNIATAAGDVVVLDAGISRFMTDGSVAVRGAVGTRGYMAPELRDDGRHVALPACDVYSLGMTYRRALDRWASTERRSTTRTDAPQPSSDLTQLRAMCDAMCRDDAAKRTPLPEVLAVLKALSLKL